MDFNASGEITLKFSDRQFRLTGRNLRELYQKFLRHLVIFVQEADETYVPMEERETVVAEIQVSGCSEEGSAIL